MKEEPRKSKEELEAIRYAHKRLSWIDNVKRVYGWTQEEAEKQWLKIENKPYKPTE